MQNAATQLAPAAPNPPTIRSVSDLSRATTSAGDHLGDLVWWELSNADIAASTLKTTWENVGLDAHLLPEPPTPEKALRTAVRRCQVGQLDRLIRLGKEDDQQLVFAVVREEKLGDGSLSHQQEARVFLDRATGRLKSDSPGHDIVRTITDVFDVLIGTHTVDDVRRTIVRTLHSLAAVTLRDSGGVYWVPRHFADTVRRLEQAINRIGASRFYVLPVHHTAMGSQALGAAARGSLDADLADLQKELDEFKATPPDRRSTLQRRLQAFDELRSRAELYRDILKVRVDDIEQSLTDMAGVVQTLLTATSN